MDFLDRLRRLSLEHGYSNNMQLSKASGVPYTTLDSFYRVGYDNVKLSTLRKLCDCLDCTMEYLVNGDPESDASPSPCALDMARKFDRLDEHSKHVVSALIDLELKRPVSRFDAANDHMGDLIRSQEEADTAVMRQASSEG